MATVQHATAGRYRADIDGLRAIAVSLVIAFHYRLALPPSMGVVLARWLHRTHPVALFPKGGFVGVDVFFVISGFLIGGILLRQLESGRLRFGEFYERRIRRILPALFVVLCFVSYVGLRFYPPTDLTGLSAELLASLTSCSNLYFLNQTGYFEAPALTRPLLHTWSLSVEEQFYVVFPLVLALLYGRARRQLAGSLLGLALASFALSVWLTVSHPSAAFYLPFSRAWELLLGTLTLLAAERFRSVRWAEAIALGGMAMLVVSAFLLHNDSHFPGLAALPPTLGAACLLYAGAHRKTYVSRLLSMRGLRFLGLISYSLYLWHWPMWVFNQQGLLLSKSVTAPVLLGIVLCVSTLSWVAVERPMRQLPARRAVVFRWAFAASAALGALGVAAGMTHGFPKRFSADDVAIASYATHSAPDWGSGCFLHEQDLALPSACLAQSASKPNVLLFGSSHAAHLIHGLQLVFPDLQFQEATASNCKPLLNAMDQSDTCLRLVHLIFDHYVPEARPQRIVLASFWTDDDAAPLQDTIRWLRAHGAAVYVVGPIPHYDVPLPTLLFREHAFRDPGVVDRHSLGTDPTYIERDKMLAAAALSAGAARYLSLRQVMCPDDRCVHLVAPGIPLQADEAHLSDAGSVWVARRMREQAFLP